MFIYSTFAGIAASVYSTSQTQGGGGNGGGENEESETSNIFNINSYVELRNFT